jgi:hypothetical protein
MKIEDVPLWMIEAYQPVISMTWIKGQGFVETEEQKKHNDWHRATWDDFKKSIGGEE